MMNFAPAARRPWHRRALRWIGAAGMALLVGPSMQAHADEQIWSALILATDAEKPKPAPAELVKYSAKIQRIFGYNQF